ncbi:chloramphenicol phosphotransferase CPT family protein [Microlunatus sp. GCM10028923]|uniref:chloramphenicol phosphotransferase CPT family protein n=1 Tax=Microlunatus sp. GCM10028923 TaxID=3273400 RepID=UPI0036133FCD
MAARIIFLNGAPSAGKSSTARALQQRLDEPHFYLGLDEFRRGYLDRVWLADHGDLFQRTVRGYLPMLAAMVRAGHPVIAEAILTPQNEALYLDLFDGLPVIFVGLTCDLEVAQARESVRNDRRRGPMDLDQPDLHTLHDHGCYDLTVDTSRIPVEQVVDRILPVLADPPEPSAFDRLRQRPTAQGGPGR